MTTTQPALSLRELAKEFADGRIDRHTFRRRRARLIDELAAYTPPAPRQQTNRREPVSHAPIPPQVKTQSNKFLIGLLVAAVFLITLLGIFFFATSDSRESARDLNNLSKTGSSLQSMDTAPTQDVVSSKVENDPIKNFMAVKDWTPESRNHLILQWDALSPESKVALSSTSWFLSFSSKLRTRINEECGLTGGEISTEVNSLIAFAAHLGLDFKPITKAAPNPSTAIPVAHKPSTSMSKAVAPRVKPLAIRSPIQNQADSHVIQTINSLETPRIPKRKLNIKSTEITEKTPIPVADSPVKMVEIPARTRQNNLSTAVSFNETSTRLEM